MVQGSRLDFEMMASGGGSESGSNLHSMVVKILCFVSFIISDDIGHSSSRLIIASILGRFTQ